MPTADEAAVQRLVTRATAGDQPDLARPRRVAAVDDLVRVVDPQVGVRASMPEQRLGDDVGRVVDELLHRAPSVRVVMSTLRPTRLSRTAGAGAETPGSGGRRSAGSGDGDVGRAAATPASTSATR